jgi:hypothetical protein
MESLRCQKIVPVKHRQRLLRSLHQKGQIKNKNHNPRKNRRLQLSLNQSAVKKNKNHRPRKSRKLKLKMNLKLAIKKFSEMFLMQN